MLRGVGCANLHVERIAAVAGADDNGAANETAKGFKDFPAELLQRGDVLGWNRIVDSIQRFLI